MISVTVMEAVKAVEVMLEAKNLTPEEYYQVCEILLSRADI